MRQKFSILTMILILAMIAIGTSLANAAAPITLTIGLQAIHAETSEGVSWIEQVAKEFEADNPGVKVEIIPMETGTYIDKLATLVVAGVAPDVFQGWGRVAREWAEAGLLLNLNPYLPANAAKDFFPAQWNALSLTSGALKGMRYGIPMYVNVVGGIAYDADAFNEAGVIAPNKLKKWTWTEFLDVAKKMTKKNNDVVTRWGFGTWAAAYWVEGFMRAAGGGLFDYNDNRNFIGDKKESIAGLEFFHSLRYEYGVSSSTTGGWQNFVERKDAMSLIYSAWTLDINKNANFNWNIVSIPTGPAGGRGAVTIADAFSVNGKTKYPELASRLALAVSSRKAGLGRLRPPFYQMPAMPVLCYDYYKLLPGKDMWVFLEAMDHAAVDCRVIYPTAEINTMVNTAFTQVLKDNSISPRQAMEALGDQVRASIKNLK